MKLASSLAITGAIVSLSCLEAAPARALSFVTFVSGKGSDSSNNCSVQASPCRTFQHALGQTIAGGEIKALDPANYFPVTISKSLTITGVDGAGILRGAAGPAITINAGASDVVNISNLTIDGFKTATYGILVNSAGSLTIRNCTVQNFTGHGIFFFQTTATRFLIADTAVADNGNVGVLVYPQGGYSAQGVLDHLSAIRNSNGIIISRTGTGNVDVTVVDSVASDNATNGFLAKGGTTLRLSHSTVTRNRTGINSEFAVRSAGNNFVTGNQTDVLGTITNDGTL